LGFRSDKKLESREFFQLSDDAFKLVADWYYFVIMALCKLPSIPAESRYLSERLGISEFEARAALQRLLRLQLVEIRDGNLAIVASTPSTTRDVPSSAIRSYHKQNLKLAEESIEKVSLELREFSSITFPADTKCLPEVKDLVMEFKRKIARIMETPTANEVYTLAIQLFPVTKDRGISV
jgi:uncharacterized protein (TIGR02147 family)